MEDIKVLEIQTLINTKISEGILLEDIINAISSLSVSENKRINNIRNLSLIDYQIEGFGKVIDNRLPVSGTDIKIELLNNSMSVYSHGNKLSYNLATKVLSLNGTFILDGLPDKERYEELVRDYSISDNILNIFDVYDHKDYTKDDIFNEPFDNAKKIDDFYIGIENLYRNCKSNKKMILRLDKLTSFEFSTFTDMEGYRMIMKFSDLELFNCIGVKYDIVQVDFGNVNSLKIIGERKMRVLLSFIKQFADN